MSGHWSRSFLIQDKSHEGSVQWLAGACPPADLSFQMFCFFRRAFCGNRLRTGAPPHTPPLRGAFFLLSFCPPGEGVRRGERRGEERRRRERLERRRGGREGRRRGEVGKEKREGELVTRKEKSLPVKMENRGFDPRTSRMLNGRSTN